MIENNVCATCRKCCTGEISGNGVCTFYTSTGCSALWENRNEGCRFYPFIVVRDMTFANANQIRVLLDTACPHYKEFEILLNIVLEKPVPSMEIHK